jgi:hypothetical protein
MNLKNNLRELAAVLLVTGVLLPSTSYADTFGSVFNIDYNGCSGGCGNFPTYGTVSVSGNGTTSLTFDADLTSNIFFHQNGNGTTFQFSISGPAVTAANVSGLTTGQGWSFVTPTNNLDALGTFQYGFNCAGNGGSNTCGSELDFTLTFASNATLANETGGQHGPLTFGLNLAYCTAANQSPCIGTGPFGATSAPVPGPIVGAGLPGLIAACGGLLALGRRRRQKFV